MTRASFAFLIDSVLFTKDTRDGLTSLGGSESACLGLARALKARDHDVHVFTTKLSPDAAGFDPWGVAWHPLEEFYSMNYFIEWDVAVVLRQFAILGGARPIRARWRILWNQDLMLPGAMPNQIMSVAWAMDEMAYVSQYQRNQWEQLQPQIASLGWVTRNGYDPDLIPADARKDPNRVIYVSRPERGLGPILAMWPRLKAERPNTTLRICRYSSMYDQGKGSWSDVCEEFDREVERVNAEIGGITYLGELNKPQLYREIMDSAVMWYPGISRFAETSCIAAIEARACETPFVGSYRGALPETIPSGTLIKGDAGSEAYQRESVNAVIGFLDGCKTKSVVYRKTQRDGLKGLEAYTFNALADEWEAHLDERFKTRSQTQAAGILHNFLHHDDHTAARLVALKMGDVETAERCQYIMDGKDQSAELYAEYALPDPEKEADNSLRFEVVVEQFNGATNVLDVACGNGAGAIALAKRYPNIRVHGVDYSERNIINARETAERLGMSDRLTFDTLSVYDYDRHELTAEMVDWLEQHRGEFDGCFVGEFIEHCVNSRALIDGLEVGLAEGAIVVYTCPSGPYTELRMRDIEQHKGHVHHFQNDDVRHVWGDKAGFKANYVVGGVSERGNPIGVWLVRYLKAEGKHAKNRDYDTLIERTRPLPSISVGIIANNEEHNIGRCLESVWRIADEIVVGDTGSQDGTMEIAKKYDARIVPIAPVDQQEDGFSGARNQILEAATGDWFLWIDCDEILTRPYLLRRYLDGSIFNGFVLRQTHLYLDGPPTWDIPVRLFKRTPDVKFYGCVHEQPQTGDGNGDIFPTLEIVDVQIAHTGYLTEDTRESKRIHRNLPLLVKDSKRFGHRVLGKVLLIREAVIQGDHFMASRDLEAAKRSYAYGVQLFTQYFDDPDHKYHRLARPWYEAGLRHLGLGWEMEIAIAGKDGGLGSAHAKPERVWVRDSEEYSRLMTYKISKMAEEMRHPPLITDPDAFMSTAKEEVAV